MTESAGDPNMGFALSLAIGLGSACVLPEELQNVQARARFVHLIDGPLLGGDGPYEMAAALGQRLREMTDASAQEMPSIQGELDRLSVALRLWSGCTAAAKTIALETRSGPNTAEIRHNAFAEFIDPAAAADEVFRAGVEAAPAFKALRGEPIDFAGVPLDSPARRLERRPT